MEPKFEGFPMEPYPIQIEFMNALYGFLNKGGISMLESPTGTGKTLSMICSALQWLVDKRKQQLSSQRGRNNVHHKGSSTLSSGDEPDWLKNFSLDNCSNEFKNFNTKTKKFVKKSNNDNNKQGFVVYDKASENCESKSDEEESFRQKKDVLVAEAGDEEYLLEEYESEGEREKMKRKASGICVSSSSEEEEEEEGFEEKEKEEKKVKIYFCSRTHSQLSQFVKELGKTVFASEIQAICLGSRKVFCINEEVLKLRSTTQINERCLELQSKKKNVVSKIKNLGVVQRIRRTKASFGCPMLRKHKLQKKFRSEVSQKGVLDIEDLVQLGNRMGTCPYYGSRSMASDADLVLLPYQSLLSKSSRESLGLNLKDNIIIIDEAHNLADSLTSMYDAKITLSQLEHTQFCFGNYLSRFGKLLGSGNRRYIQTLMVLTRAFMKVIGEDISCGSLSQAAEKESEATTSAYSMAINDFLFSLNIDNINLFKLITYIKESNIIHKVSGYADKVATSLKRSEKSDGRKIREGESSLSSFQALDNMLFSLTNNDGDGRIIISRERQICHGQQGGFIKYVMLTGEKIFHEIVDQAHAVILAGGTLQPIEEMQERLFPWLPSDKLQFFSCGHIVHPESILPIAVSRGPSGHSFDFSYGSRSSSIMIKELGLLLCNLSTVVPEGIVVFFSSFDYEGQVYDSWKASGILERIGKKKRIFREPRRSSDVEALLTEYKKTIDTLTSDNQKDSLFPYNGAMLLAVVGGKVSEGINFSDGMGRCIVMAGLPYPSPSDIELMERVKHIEGLGDSNLDRTSKILVSNYCNDGDIKAGFEVLRSCKRRGKEYYENLCMKAVNQSIGRAIRHINDYAAILLVDARYSSDPSKRSSSHPTNKLPQWIQCRLVSTTHNYGEVHQLLHQFFRTKTRNHK